MAGRRLDRTALGERPSSSSFFGIAIWVIFLVECLLLAVGGFAMFGYVTGTLASFFSVGKPSGHETCRRCEPTSRIFARI
jgi:hypothetical protein